MCRLGIFQPEKGEVYPDKHWSVLPWSSGRTMSLVTLADLLQLYMVSIASWTELHFSTWQCQSDQGWWGGSSIIIIGLTACITYITRTLWLWVKAFRAVQAEVSGRRLYADMSFLMLSYCLAYFFSKNVMILVAAFAAAQAGISEDDSVQGCLYGCQHFAWNTYITRTLWLGLQLS